MKKVTMQDIANKIGVSRMTVSKCFQNSDDISIEMKEKILSMAGKLGYIYNKPSRYNILVLAPEVFLDKTEDFYSSLYKRLNEIAGLNNIILSLLVIKNINKSEINIKSDFSDYDGILILGQLSKSVVEKIQKSAIPSVCIDFYYRNINLDTIVCNNFHASYNITSYLIDKGHHEIAFVGSLNQTSSINDRFLGYYKALLESQIKIKDEYQIDDRNYDGQLEEIKLPKVMPTAFVCNNDHAAYLLIRQLKKINYDIPKDISVVGFDDVIYSNISEPSITTMRVRRKYMAEQAIKLLLRRIKTKNAEIRNLNIECTMIQRESVNECKKS